MLPLVRHEICPAATRSPNPPPIIPDNPPSARAVIKTPVHSKPVGKKTGSTHVMPYEIIPIVWLGRMSWVPTSPPGWYERSLGNAGIPITLNLQFASTGPPKKKTSNWVPVDHWRQFLPAQSKLKPSSRRWLDLSSRNLEPLGEWESSPMPPTPPPYLDVPLEVRINADRITGLWPQGIPHV